MTCPHLKGPGTAFNDPLPFRLQVVTGGQYDVDVKLEGPSNKVLYETQKAQFDSKTFTTEVTHHTPKYLNPH